MTKRKRSLAIASTGALLALAALAWAPRATAQRYLSERVIKGIQVQAPVSKLQSGFVAQVTGPNEVTIRRAGDAKSVEGKLECACSSPRAADACAIKVVKDGVVCGDGSCGDGTCKVRAAAGFRLP